MHSADSWKISKDKRGHVGVVQMRGMSSALSAASSACDHVRNWVLGTEPGVFVSMGVISDGSYGAPKVCCLPASHVPIWHLTCSVLVEIQAKWNGEHLWQGQGL